MTNEPYNKALMEHRMGQVEGTVKAEADSNAEFRRYVRESLERIESRFHQLDKEVAINKTKAGLVSGGVGFLASLPMSLTALIKSLGASS